MSPITKAVIPAAGFGTRMLPAAKAVPKEMLPVLNRPTIEYVVEEAVVAGVDDVLLVVSGDKKAIEDHFDRHAELEARLAEQGREDWIATVRKLREAAQIFSVRQHEQLGLGHAVLQAEAHVRGEAFHCLLGDTIFRGVESPADRLAAVHAEHGGTVIALERVPPDRVSRYGIVAGEPTGDGRTVRVTGLVEKPDPADAPSDLAIAARYVLSPGIFDVLRSTPRGAGGEIQLTDALATLCQHEPVHGVVIDARRHDIGNPIDWLKTNIALAAEDAGLWDELAPTLRALLDAGPRAAQDG